MINVEVHATHCRMASTKSIVLTVVLYEVNYSMVPGTYYEKMRASDFHGAVSWACGCVNRCSLQLPPFREIVPGGWAEVK